MIARPSLAGINTLDLMAPKAPQFIGWSAPLSMGVALYLLEEARQLRGPNAEKGLPIDLGSHRVIVPSNFASRFPQIEQTWRAKG